MVGPSINTVLHDLGRRVAELRAGRGLTQEAISAKLDVNVQYIQRIERGAENLTIASLVRLADQLGTQVADLFAAPANRMSRPGRPRKREPLQDGPAAKRSPKRASRR